MVLNPLDERMWTLYYYLCTCLLDREHTCSVVPPCTHKHRARAYVVRSYSAYYYIISRTGRRAENRNDVTTRGNIVYYIITRYV